MDRKVYRITNEILFNNQTWERNNMKNVLKSFALIVVTLSFFCAPPSAYAKKFKLTGLQKAGNIAHGPTVVSPPVVLTAPTTIVKIDRHADRFSLWQNGKVFVTLEKGQELSGMLPAGRYTLVPSVGGNVTIYLDTAIKPQPLTLWAKQKRGPNHWFKGNVVVLSRGYKIVEFKYDGREAVGIFIKDEHHYTYRFISRYNIKEKGPAVLTKNKRIPAKTLVGFTLGPGVFVAVPGIGTADGIVYTEIKLKPI